MERRNQPFDVCIVCALYEEAKAVLNEFSIRCNVSFLKEFSSTDRYEYRYTNILNNRGESLSVLVTWLSDSGPTQTGLDLKPFLHEFRPRFVAMTGFCAGYKKKVKRGDLIVAEYAYFYEAGKIISEAEGLSRHLQEMKTAFSTSQVLHYAKGFEGWKEPLKKMKSDRLKRQLRNTEEPRCVIAPMASAMAVRQDDPFLWLREHYDRNTIGLDMEAATFYQALRAVSHIHGLVVKGVCDHADMNKNDTYHDYAARMSAVYLLAFIKEYVTEQTMPRRDVPPSSSRAGPSGVWNVSYRRNPYFTGRDDLLEQLDQHFKRAGQNDAASTRRAALTQPQAIKGLGGIGKTQLAVEYAYRSQEHSRYTHTFWVNAASEEALLTDFVRLAELLPAFSAQGETDQRKLVEAIKHWLEQCQECWLLIFDNADDIALVHNYLPQRGNGNILLTTRAHAVGSLATSIEVDTMGWLEGTHLLLRRAQRFEHASDEEVNQAGNIVVELNHFPLALDQAGAYIEETQCSFADYLNLYQAHQQELLARRGEKATDYPHSVATTWSLSFQKVQQTNPAAAELLDLCSFLAPDRIPEELLRDGAVYWPAPLQQAVADPLLFQQLIADLFKFSLVKRLVEDHTLSIHRLVQAVQRDRMKPEIQRQWAEGVVQAVNEVFPRGVSDVATWSQCLRYLDQAQACSVLIGKYDLMIAEAVDILNRAGIYLYQQALYTIAEPLYQHAVRISQQILGPQHSSTASSLNNLASLYKSQGKYTEAEPLYQQALHIREEVLGPEHPYTASSLNNLASLYEDQGKYGQAEPLYQHALAISERQLGAEHSYTVIGLNNLAGSYKNQGKYTEAEPLYRRVLTIREHQLGSMHPDTATALNNLASLYKSQGKYTEAEPLYQQALHIREEVLGPEHDYTASILNNLADLYVKQEKYTEAEPLYQRALHIWEHVLGPEHPDTATALNNLAALYKDQEEYVQAEPLYRRALSIREQQLGAAHPDTADSLNSLAVLYVSQEKYTEAEPLYQRALHIWEHVLGPEHPDTATALNNLATLYKDQGKYEQAEPLYQRALRIWEHTLGPQHPNLGHPLYGLASLCQEQGKYEQAEPLYQRALRIWELHWDPQHPSAQMVRNSYASLLRDMGRNEEANQLEANT